jgi:hypothetical protein
MSEIRRVRIQLKDRPMSNLLSMLASYQDKTPNHPIIPLLLELIKERKTQENRPNFKDALVAALPKKRNAQE